MNIKQFINQLKRRKTKNLPPVKHSVKVKKHDTTLESEDNVRPNKRAN